MTSASDRTAKPKPPREDRLADALRTNLKRRKAAARDKPAPAPANEPPERTE